MAKVRGFLIIVLGVFVCSAAPLFLNNALNIWEIPWSTWQIIISAGVFGVVTWLAAVLFPYTVKPSKGLKFPEA
jgi:hypothetical protein